MTTPVDVLIYQPDGATLIAQVADVISVTATDEKDGPGGGTLQIAYDNPTLAANPTLLDQRNIVKVKVGGTVRAAWMIRKTIQHYAGDGGEAAQVWDVSGPGLMAWFDDAVLHQEFENSYSDTIRYFGWGGRQGTWYDEDAWGKPVRVAKRADPDFSDPNNRYRKKPANWPDTGDTVAWWVWDRASANVGAPVGYAYFRYKLVTAGTEVPYTLFLTADNLVDVQLDGEPLATVKGRRAFKRTYSVDFELDTGTHYLGFRVRNKNRGASLIAALFQFDEFDDEQDTGTLVTVTGQNTNWRMLAYPDVEPGWTAGEVLARIVTEANSRSVASVGYLNGDDFTDTVDSDGTAWPTYVWRFNVGDTYTNVIAELRDYDVDVRINPDTLVLEAYDTRGSSATDVLLDTGVQITAAAEELESRIANAILLNDEEAWRTVTDTDSISSNGRIEAYLNLSALPVRSATKVANKNLDLYGVPVEAVSLDYIPTGVGDVPWVDFTVGDTITAPTNGGVTSRRVVSISVAIDSENADPVYTVELDALSAELRAKIQRMIDRLSAGGGGNLADKVPGKDNPPGGGSGPGGGGPGGGGGDNPYRPADPVFEPPTDDPWIRPDDPTNPGDGYEQEWGVGQVSATVATDMVNVWASEYGDPLKLALLTADPTLTSGEWSISGVECTEPDYARIDLNLSELDSATGNNPVYRPTNVDKTFPTNSSGSDWPAVTHLVVLDNAGTGVLSVIELPTPIVVADASAAQIVAGNLQFVVGSA
jgi:hypothetical protein